MRYRKFEYGILFFGLALITAAFIVDTPSEIFSGIQKIILTEGTLITDYIALAGTGASIVNAALVMMASIGLLMLSGDTPNGFTFAEAGLMLGFSFFGKNIANIWPIILGTWLYSLYKKEPFSKYAGVSILSTALAPVVSFICLYRLSVVSVAIGITAGIIIGFLLPSLSSYTFKIQNGMNLYNMGFACGMLAMILVAVLRRFGMEDNSADYWATGHNLPFGIALAIINISLILIGTFGASKKRKAAWKAYAALLKTSGRAPSDFVRMFGSAPVLINMGINGIVATVYILVTGGDLNGATIGGIITIIGFSAYGKHLLNILPVMIGIALGDFLMLSRLNAPAMQLAGLFGTALAPISGYFGWPYGILAGILHSAVVLFAGTPIMGLNLYNNGFSAGILAMVLYPVLTSVAKNKKVVLQDKDYFDIFTHEEPIDINANKKRTEKKE